MSLMRSFKYLFIAVAGSMIMASCGKIEKLPPEPSIRFTSFEVLDTIDRLGNGYKAGILKFYFQDGDGDLGLAAPVAGSGGDSTNLFFTLYRRKAGILSPAPADDPLKPSDYRIPYMERPGQNKILKGTISVTFLYLFATPNDTIKYEFYIKDRAEHLSNTASTCEIALKTNEICTDTGN
jgi:hypothetical protein